MISIAKYASFVMIYKKLIKWILISLSLYLAVASILCFQLYYESAVKLKTLQEQGTVCHGRVVGGYSRRWVFDEPAHKRYFFYPDDGEIEYSGKMPLDSPTVGDDFKDHVLVLYLPSDATQSIAIHTYDEHDLRNHVHQEYNRAIASAWWKSSILVLIAIFLAVLAWWIGRIEQVTTTIENAGEMQ